MKEENPEAKEEDIEEEERNTKNQELEKVRLLKDKFENNKNVNLYEICEINADFNYRVVIEIIDKLWQVDLVLVRNMCDEPLNLNPLLYKINARGYDLSNLSEEHLTKELHKIKDEIN